MPGLIVSLMKNCDSIGKIVYKFDSYFTDAFSRTRDLIDNYNRNLAGVSTVDELLAARFFDKDTLKGTKGTTARPMFMKGSLECVEEITKKFGYTFDKKSCRNDTHGVVAIEYGDRFNMKEYFNFDGTEMYALIKLDDKMVSFGSLFKVYTRKDYVDMCRIDPDSLNVSPYNYEYLPFNQMEEACDFIFKNANGFIDNYDEDYIYVPYIPYTLTWISRSSFFGGLFFYKNKKPVFKPFWLTFWWYFDIIIIGKIQRKGMLYCGYKRKLHHKFDKER